jgi:hypothetical protein
MVSGLYFSSINYGKKERCKEAKHAIFYNAQIQSLKGCCYIRVDSATTALLNGACTYRCISKQIHYKTPFSHMKSLEISENYITLFCLEK